MKRPAWFNYARLASTYQEALRVNTSFNDRKADLQARGVVLLFVGILFLVLVPILFLWPSVSGLMSDVASFLHGKASLIDGWYQGTTT